MFAAAIWHNVLQPLNVSGETGGTVDPLDVLTIINEINSPKFSNPTNGSLPLEVPDGTQNPFFDIDCDSRVSPLDVLNVINAINSGDYAPDWVFSGSNVGGTTHGRVVNAGCSPKLIEGDSLFTDLSQMIVVPDDTSAIRVSFEAPVFDTLSQNAIRDSFEILLLDQAGQPLVLPYGIDREASYNWSESTQPIAGVGTQNTTSPPGSISTATFNVSGLAAGTRVQVKTRLLNNDSDTDTGVVIRRVEIVDSQTPAPKGMPVPASNSSPRSVVDPNLLVDVTSSVELSFGRTTMLEGNDVLVTDLQIKNINRSAISGRMLLVVDNLSDVQLSLLKPDGYLELGKPYFILNANSSEAWLATGQSSAPQELRFSNPSKQQFQYRFKVLAEINSAPTGFSTTPLREIQAGKNYETTVKANDPDGQKLTYTKVVGPAAMAVDSTTGEIRWLTTASDIGNQSVVVRATDPFGLSVDQSFTISVLENVQNRPPIFTSTPNTDATVAGSWEVNTQSLGAIVPAIDKKTQTLNLNGMSVGVGEQAPNGRMFQTGHEVDVGLSTSTARSADIQNIPSVAQADLNGDGTLDVITSAAFSVDLGFPRGYDVQNFVSVVLNNGDGSFAAATKLPIESSGDRSITEFTARNLSVADFDGDGKADILALYGKLGFYGDAFGPYQLLFWKGLGNGQFAALQKTALAAPLQWIQAADMNGDGKLDLVAADNRYGSTLGVLKGNGDGTFGVFTATATYPGAAYASIPAIVDVDGKNGLDVVLTNFSPARVDIYVNDGSGNLSESTSFPVTSQLGDGGQSIAAGDFNGDGKVDVAVATFNSFGVWTGAGDGVGFTLNNSNAQLGYLFNSAGTTAKDINGDGKLDLLYGRANSGDSANQRGFFVALGQGDGSFAFDRYSIGNDTVDSDNTNSQREAAVLAGDYNLDGVMDLAVASIGGGGSRSRVTVIDGITPGNFASPKQVATANALSNALIGDVNNDGIADIVHFENAGNQSSSIFKTRLGNGDGTLGPSQSALGVSGSPISSYLLDINKDGKLDLVFSLIGQDFRGSVYGINQVALGNGDGTFSTSFSTFQGGFFYGNSLFTGDFNNDGYTDLIAFAGAINAPGTGTFVDGLYDIYLNDGGAKGTFTLASHRVIPVGSGQDDSPKSVAIADFDGDGKLDVVNFIQKTSNTPFKLLLLKGTGDGKLADPISTDVLTTNTDSASITWTAAGDMNGDGKADIVAFGAFGQLSIFLGNGDGTFTTPVQYPSGSYPTNTEQFKLLDFNGDGKLDVVKIDTGPFGNKEGISVRLGNGDGTLQASQAFTTFGRLTTFSTGDLDGDGVLDVLGATGDSQATAYLGTKPGLSGVTTGDVNGDGKADLLAVNTANDRVKVLLGNGNNTFNRQVDVIVGRGPVTLATADFNGDGKLDIVTVNRTGKSVTVLRGDGLGGFTRTDISVGVKPVSVTVGDFTGDGKQDILVADDGSNAAYLLINTGNGFAAPVAIPLGDKPGKVTLADITDDGKLDAVFTLPESKRLMILPGIGNGTFGLPIYVNLPATPGAITSGDLNQDGKIDLAVTFPAEGTAAVLYSRGGGLFAKPQTIRVGANPTAIVAQDTNGDGRLDLIVTNSGDNTTSVILNKYDATKLYRYTVTATDPDGDALSFDLSDAPGGMILNSGTGEIVWAPTGDQLGSNPVTIKVSDGQGGSATQTFSIAVAPSSTNSKPFFTSTPNEVVQTSEAFTYTPKAIDTDGTTLRYRLVNGPAGASIDPLTGKVSWDGRSGALSFNQKPFDNGGSSGVSVPDRPELQPASMTAEGWFRFDDPTKNQNQVLLSKLRNLFFGSYSFSLTYLNGNLYARVTGSDSQGFFVSKDAAFTWSPLAGRWYHLAMTFDDATGAIGLLINGNLVATATANFHLSYTSGSTSDFNIGKLYGEGFVGSASNIRLWNVARTPQQIQADLVRQVPTNAPNLLLNLPFNDDDSQTIRDVSINHFHGRRTTGAGPWPTNTIGLAVEQTQPFTISVEDGRGGFDEQTFSVQVVAPFRSTIRGNVGRSDNGLSLAGWGVRVNGQRVLTDVSGNYSLDNLLAGTYVVALEAPVGWTVGSPASGSYNVTIGESETATSKDFRIAPVNASQATGPKFLPISPMSVPARSAFRTSVLALDPDSRPITYSLSLAPAGMAIDPSTGMIAWTPTLKDVGTARILVKAVNDRGAIDLLEFTLTVLSPNIAPIITSTPPSRAYDGVPLRYDLLAQDAEQSTLIYSLLAAPNEATIGANTGRITWTPATAQLGNQLFTVKVSDGVGGEAIQSFTLTVAASSGNHSPVLTPSLRSTTKVGLSYRGQLSAKDADGDTLTYSLVSGPTGFIASTDGAVSWVPTTGQIGDNTLTVAVTDGRGGRDERTFAINVSSVLVNTSPRFTSTPPTFASVNRTFQVDLKTIDQESDVVAFELLSGPSGLSLDPVRGTMRWTPAADQLGSASVSVRAYDPFGGQATQSFAIVVRWASGPPAITSTPPTEAAVGQAFLYSVIAIDAEGAPLTYSLLQAPSGMTINSITGELSWTPGPLQLGQQAVIIQVSDAAGASTSQGFAILVSAGAANRPPVISTVPPLRASQGSLLTFSIQATDPEGSAIRYELRRGPSRMTVDANTGLVSWDVQDAPVGPTVVTIAAFDAEGAAGILSFELTVLPANNAPTITGSSPTTVFAGGLFRYDVLATDIDLDPLAFSLSNAPNGMSVDAFGRINWLTSVADIGTRTATVQTKDGRGGVATRDFIFNVVADTSSPKVNVIPSSSRVAANSPEVFARYNIAPFYPTATVRVTATDNVGVAGLTITANGKSVVADANGNITFHFEDWGFGTIRVTATAIDAAGNSGVATKAFAFVPFGDDPAAASVSNPIAIITSPTDSESTGGFVNIRGTATSDSFTSYSVQFRRADQSTFTTIFDGKSRVVDGILAKWDTSLLENDQYVLRLEEIDEVGGVTAFEQSVGVSGNLKLGNFRLSFADLTIPVAGIPITLARTYDTLRADRNSDMGYGWRLEYRNTNLQTGLPKTGLEDYGIYSAFKPGTKVYLTLPGGQRQGFTFTPDLRALPSFGGQPLIVATPRFTPDRGITSTLSTRGGTYILNAANELTTLGGQNYNPAAEDFGGGYTLTSNDGTQFFIDGVSGLMKSAKDRNDNVLTFSESGISSSSGVNVTFERDAKGRITKATDPAGNSVKYGYDTKGDLVTVTDRMGNVTKFTYRTDRAHYLDSVIDPLGRTGVKAVYGPDGRLTGTLDANGNGPTVSYDPDNSLVTTTDALGNKTISEYDNRGNVVSQTDALGGVTRTTYDLNNNITSTTDALGRKTMYTVDDSGNVTGTIDPLGHTRRATFDSYGNQLSSTDALGRTTKSEFDARGTLLATVDVTGAKTTISSDSRGQLTSVTLVGGAHLSVGYTGTLATSSTDLNGLASQFSFNANGLSTGRTVTVSTASGPTNATERTEYDADGRVIATTDASGATRRTEYDAAGQVFAEIDPRGRRTTYEYDSAGRRIRVTRPDGSSTQTAYDAAGRATSITDALGRTTRYYFDALGRKIETVYADDTPLTLADNPRTQTVYNLVGEVIAQLDELGNRSEFEYDLNGHQTVVRDPLGNVTRTMYDATGAVISVKNALDRTTMILYDDFGRQIGAVAPDGSRTSQTLNEHSLPESKSDELGHTTSYSYTASGQLQRVTDALGNSIRYEYDTRSKLVKQTDANGHITRWEYDILGREVARILPGGQAWRTEYDDLGQVSKTIDPNGQATTFIYDEVGRVLTKTTADGAVVQFKYTLNGQINTVTDARGVTRFVYDVRDRLVSRTEPDDQAIRYTYDDAGRTTSMTTLGGTVRYGYDAASRLTSVTDPTGGITKYTFNAVGSLTRTDYSNGVVELREYDTNSRLTRKTASGSTGTLTDYRYTLDATGRAISFTGDGETVQYTYDAIYRLTNEQATSGRNISFTYDAVGNRLTRTDSVGSTVYQYDVNDRLTRTTTGSSITDFTYDDAGNQLRQQTGADHTDYTWDASNRMIRASVTKAGATAIEEYKYDANGNRVAVVNAAGETRYLLDLNGQLSQVAAEYTPSGLLIATMVRGNGVIGETRNGVSSILLTDRLGSVRVVTNATGVELARYAYDAFGNIVASSGGAGTPLRFTGEPQSLITGLNFFRARSYDASTGRFFNADPFIGRLQNAFSRHRYQYGDVDPVNKTDPSGRETLLTELQALQLKTILLFSFGGAVGGTVKGIIFGQNVAKEAFKGAFIGFIVGVVVALKIPGVQDAIVADARREAGIAFARSGAQNAYNITKIGVNTSTRSLFLAEAENTALQQLTAASLLSGGFYESLPLLLGFGGTLGAGYVAYSTYIGLHDFITDLTSESRFKR